MVTFCGQTFTYRYSMLNLVGEYSDRFFGTLASIFASIFHTDSNDRIVT